MITDTEILRLTGISAIERAHERNVVSLAWQAEDAGRFVGLLVEDEDFWTQQNVHNGFDLERHLAIGTYSDLYKEIHGFRLRRIDTEAMSLSALMSRIDALNEEIQSEQDYWDDYTATQDALEAEEEARLAEAAVAAQEDAVWSIQDALEGIR